MQSHPWHPHRPAVTVVPRMPDMLNIGRDERAAPDVRSVVALDDVFASVSQPAVSQKETLPSKRQIQLVVFGNSIRSQGNADLVVLAAPLYPSEIAAERNGLIDFSVGI